MQLWKYLEKSGRKTLCCDADDTHTKDDTRKVELLLQVAFRSQIAIGMQRPRVIGKPICLIDFLVQCPLLRLERRESFVREMPRSLFTPCSIPNPSSYQLPSNALHVLHASTFELVTTLEPRMDNTPGTQHSTMLLMCSSAPNHYKKSSSILNYVPSVFNFN